MFASVERLVEEFERGALSRRDFVVGLAAIAAGCAAPAAAQEKAPPSSRPAVGPVPVRGYSHAALTVTDLARSAAFYRDHFGMRVTSEGPRAVFLSMGEPFLTLFAVGSGHSRRNDPGLDHLAFAVEGWTFEGMVERLRARGLEPWTEGGRIYFRDPDGIVLQVSP
ncbi:MAG TPA: VOC family protein [Planctomycetota bacterium]|jgi:catechol 2,3-dioxygenase-like lactoylglutathione lyase family enzyme|nr:VOC family protein [Planctomycetota bacterium]